MLTRRIFCLGKCTVLGLQFDPAEDVAPRAAAVT